MYLGYRPSFGTGLSLYDISLPLPQDTSYLSCKALNLMKSINKATGGNLIFLADKKI